jgi:hypothetical protein
MFTKEEIQNNLRSNPKWIHRSLVVLYERQTSDEQQTGQTSVYNNRGFNSSDSRYLTYCSKWVLSGRTLNEKHLQKCGGRLPKYWKQIQDLIKEKGN